MTEFSPAGFENFRSNHHAWIDRYAPEQRLFPRFLSANQQEYWTEQGDILVQSYDGNESNFKKWFFEGSVIDQYKILELLGSGKWEKERNTDISTITKKQTKAAELFTLTMQHYYKKEPEHEEEREQFNAKRTEFFENYRFLDMDAAVLSKGLDGVCDMIEQDGNMHNSIKNDNSFLRKIVKKYYGKNGRLLDDGLKGRMMDLGIDLDWESSTTLETIDFASKPIVEVSSSQ